MAAAESAVAAAGGALVDPSMAGMHHQAMAAQEQVPTDMSLPEGVETWKLSDLRNWLDKRNKPSYGKKEDLLERIKRLANGEIVADKRAYNRFQPGPSAVPGGDGNSMGVEGWKLSELRTYLETRNKPSYGKKEDLVKRIRKLANGEPVADKRAYKRKKRARENLNDLLYLYPGLAAGMNPMLASNMAMALMGGQGGQAAAINPMMNAMLAQQMLQAQMQTLLSQGYATGQGGQQGEQGEAAAVEAEAQQEGQIVVAEGAELPK
eukprot:CAMPEP_0118852600 /NCGR_PEP_ID=MMETSP1163-20130328/1532_1 /TAXON_ID=124430 /ORGANISM="Phaeomonas parva, Strain CCMP2877" /LENGTH=263 /DNA_ID=CAMNT_0006785041 /DNA_START=193 /DNA_END=984 /DNA_ORIENTATION=-